MQNSEQIEKILKIKSELGKDIVILAHHYQTDEVYRFADFVGDSFKLARDAANKKDAKYIVFCGVKFMAEAARILCGENQRVFLPDSSAGCPMADMADIDDVETAWEIISKATDISGVVPVTYMNSSAEIKGFCGANGGIVCTSSNAGRVFDWALSKGDKILFLPDENLGRNTARLQNIKEVVLWKREENEGGLSAKQIRSSKVIVWNGFCHVHTDFKKEHVEIARKKYPDCRIIVHPECREDVVLSADASGSTEQIKKYVENAAEGSTIIIGTEINMVRRLAREHGSKKIFPLLRSLCPNMFKTSAGDLLQTIENIGKTGEVLVDSKIAKNAKIALQNMLNI